MRVKIPRMAGFRKVYVAIFALSSVLLLFQWQFHTFTTLLSNDRIGKNFGDSLHDGPVNPTKLVIERLQRDKESSKKVIDSLHHQIDDLQQLLKIKMDQLVSIKKGGDVSLVEIGVYPDADKVAHYLRNQVDNAYIVKPHQYRNEYDISPFTSFTRTSLYNLELGLIKQPEKSLTFHEDLHRDLLEVIEAGTKTLDNTDFDFVEGFYRTQYQAGTQYELVFRSHANTSAPVQLVTLFRPFAPIHLVSLGEKKATETVHVIVPLQGRGDSLRRYMDNFETMAIAGDGHVHLTVVCYGEEALNDAKTVLADVERDTNFKSYQIVPGPPGNFARGRALQEGTSKVPGENPLMFFCDVDMFFTTHFLSQCRSQTMPGMKVFYPIVFSLYNPEIVYKDKETPSLRDQQVIRRENGFWRDFGFGMTCQYKNDFNDIGGFDLTIKGWGSEDVLLYRKYTRSTKYQVVRTPVNTLFHHWHPKHCDRSLSLEQYNACLRTRSLTEGSQIQLGMLYLKDKEIS